MNKQEFEAWKAKTEKSTNKWTLDQTWESRGDYLIYKGGESGSYIMIIEGRTAIGDYEDAYPHIGEACFKELYSRQFKDNNEAMTRLIEKAGLSFLIELFS